MVRPGGVLQYSTCTWSRRKTKRVAALLEAHPEFAPRVLPLDGCFCRGTDAGKAYITLFPDVHGNDGFLPVLSVATKIRLTDGSPAIAY